jgi:parallel beta-helix repeat protein
MSPMVPVPNCRQERQEKGCRPSWYSRKGAGPILHIASSARATVRDMGIRSGKQADAVVIAGDPPDSRVITRQVWADGAESAMLAKGLTNSNVYLVDSGHAGSKVGVKVIGAGAEGMETRKAGHVIFNSGASSDNEYSYEVANGGWLLVRDIWYESGNRQKFMRCTDAGIFCYNNGNAAPRVVNCTLVSNTAQRDGGAIYISDSSSPRIVGNIIAFNNCSGVSESLMAGDMKPSSDLDCLRLPDPDPCSHELLNKWSSLF